MARTLWSALRVNQQEISTAVSAIAPESEPNLDFEGSRLEGRSVELCGTKPRGREMRNQPARFPRSARLLRHADFERVYKHGRRHFSSTMTVFYLQREPQAGSFARPISGCRVGFTVSRAHGGAVVRNRMRRRLREAVRLSRPPIMPDVDVVINPKKSLLTAEFTSIVNEVTRAFVVIGKANSEARKPKAEA